MRRVTLRVPDDLYVILDRGAKRSRTFLTQYLLQAGAFRAGYQAGTEDLETVRRQVGDAVKRLDSLERRMDHR